MTVCPTLPFPGPEVHVLSLPPPLPCLSLFGSATRRKSLGWIGRDREVLCPLNDESEGRWLRHGMLAQPWLFSVPVFLDDRRKFFAVLSEALYTYEAVKWVCQQIPLLEGWRLITVVNKDFADLFGTIHAIYLYTKPIDGAMAFLDVHPFVYVFPERESNYNAQRFAEFIESDRASTQDVQPSRGGVYGKQLKAKIERIVGRCQQVKRLVDGLTEEVEELYALTHRSEKRRRVEEDAPGQDRHDDTPETQRYEDHHEDREDQPGMDEVSHGRDERDDQSEQPDQGEEDDATLMEMLHHELGEPAGRLWAIRTSARSRRTYRIQYLADSSDVADLHYEYARIAKKGAATFALQANSLLIDGRKRLSTLPDNADVIAIPWRDQAEPPSAMRRGGFQMDWRGGAPSSARAKLARKLSRHLRRLQHLPLSQKLITKLVQMYIVPLLYCSEMASIPEDVSQVDKMIRKAVWGSARCSSNWAAVHALCIQGHRTDCILNREYEAFKSIWTLARDENSRKELLAVWHLDWVPRGQGLWHEFLLIVAHYGGRLTAGGGLDFNNYAVTLHLNMPAKIYQHQVRLLQRCHLLQQSQQAVPLTFDVHVSDIDWDATRKKVPCHPAVGTVLSNGVNTMKRAFHHFHSARSPLCEHSCGEEDGVSHRVLDCEGTSELRRRCRLGPREVELIRTSCRATSECAIWEFPADTRAWRLRVEAGPSLWPTETWMQKLMQEEIDDPAVQIQFHYRRIDGGLHPELKRHSAQLTADDIIPLPGQTVSRCDCYTRHMWEMDALIIAALVSIIKAVSVTISGLQAPLTTLWSDIVLMRSSNVYLSRMCYTLATALIVMRMLSWMTLCFGKTSCPRVL